MGSPFTHVLTYSAGVMVELVSRRPRRDFFAAVLHRLDGEQRWGLGEDFDNYLQAGGSADALTVEIFKPAGVQWNCDRVRYVVGHPHEPGLPLDVDIPMPGELKVSAAEVFGAQEAADLFDSYHQTGDLPSGLVLRPAQGYRADGTTIDLGGIGGN